MSATTLTFAAVLVALIVTAAALVATFGPVLTRALEVFPR